MVYHDFPRLKPSKTAMIRRSFAHFQTLSPSAPQIRAPDIPNEHQARPSRWTSLGLGVFHVGWESFSQICASAKYV